MDGDSIVELVTLWLKEFYEARNLVHHHPLYPFAESQLRELGKEKPPVRKVLQWCTGHFGVPGSTPPANGEQNPVEVAFNKELAAVGGSIETWIEDEVTLVKALWQGFSTVIGQTIKEVKIDRIEEVKAKGTDKGYIDFKIICKENGKPIKIGVAVIQQSSGKGIGAGLKRLTEYKKFDFTRSCLVRSKEINPKAALAQKYLSELLSPKLGGKWVLLKVEAIKTLLAIHFVYLGREDYELSEEQIFDFIVQKKLAAENDLIKDILIAASGQVPTGLVDEDSVVDINPIPNNNQNGEHQWTAR